ncbi:hypothetical protein ACFLXB_02395 [Chloroflexota bacterium]
MNPVYYFVSAIALGWLITDFMHNRGNLYFNLLLSVIGAYLAGFFGANYLGIPTIFYPLNLPTLGVTLAGTFILVLPFNLSNSRRR